jgi:hypothetical protein
MNYIQQLAGMLNNPPPLQNHAVQGKVVGSNTVRVDGKTYPFRAVVDVSTKVGAYVMCIPSDDRQTMIVVGA